MPELAAISTQAASFAETRTQPKTVKEAAQQFEALLLGQMLASMRSETGGGWMGTGDDQSSAPMAEYAEQMVAQVLASQGGMGLANIVQQGLDKANTPASVIPAP